MPTLTPAEKPGQFRNLDNLGQVVSKGSEEPENRFKTA
jgi:hypothetical protein